MEKTLDVVGLGNPLMDLLLQVDEAYLASLGLTKGTMNLIDAEALAALQKKLEGKELKKVPAGACANTIMGASLLGATCGFKGKLGADPTADFYEHVLTQDNIRTNFVRDGSLATGQVYSFITPDGERTMATHLGAAITMDKSSVNTSFVRQGKILYLTAYMLEAPNLREAALTAIAEAKENGTRVAVDLADPELIKRCKEDLLQIVKEHVDICFVNEHEAQAITGKSPRDALDVLSEYCDIAVVKLGPEGSLIKQQDEVFTIAPVATQTVDTTGAGDLFASGFLYALSQGQDLQTCGNVGSLVAAKVVSQIGARLDQSIVEPVSRIMR